MPQPSGAGDAIGCVDRLRANVGLVDYTYSDGSVAGSDAGDLDE